MKILFLSLTVLLFSYQKQSNLDKLQLFSDKDVYDWKDCIVPTREYLSMEVPKLRKHFNEYVANIDSIEKFLHFIDLNGDSNLDVIYSGTSGSASDFVKFLLKTKDDYTSLFEEYTNLRDIEFKNGILVSYTGLDLGCCADYVIKETKYKISKDLQRTIIYRKAMTTYTELPKVLFDMPQRFTIEDNVQKMRSSPLADDSGVFIYDTIGNVVSSYIKGSKGSTWSHVKDSTGQSWWFVEMDPNYQQIDSKINSKYDTIPERNLGWMNLKHFDERENK